MVEVEEERKIKRKIMTGGRQTEQDGEYGMGIKKRKKRNKGGWPVDGWMMRKEVGERRVKKEKEK